VRYSRHSKSSADAVPDSYFDATGQEMENSIKWLYIFSIVVGDQKGTAIRSERWMMYLRLMTYDSKGLLTQS
jgi:hypothetical protein